MRADYRVVVRDGKQGEAKTFVMEDELDAYSAADRAARRSGFTDPFVYTVEEIGL